MVSFVPTPIGNLEDITLRALRTFEKATLILCEDTRETKKLMRLLHERFGMQPPQADFISFHEHNQQQRLERYGKRLVQERVIYVSDAGMPCISDPGQALVAYCQAHAIEYDVLPGPSASITAYAASGFDSGMFLFVGFLSPKKQARQALLATLLQQKEDVVVFEAPHRLTDLLRDIASIDAQRRVFLAKEISKKFQRYFIDRVDRLLERLSQETIRGEWVAVIEAKKQEKITDEQIEAIILSKQTPKQKAKQLASLTGENVKVWYERIVSRKLK